MAQRLMRRAKVAARRCLWLSLGVPASTWALFGRGCTNQAVGQTPRRILAIRLDLLGDLLLTMPAVRALHRAYPEAEITMLVLPYTAPVAERFPYVSKVVSFDINRLRPSGDLLDPTAYRDLVALVASLRRERFDLCVSFHGRAGALLALASGARLLAGYSLDAYPGLFDVALPGRRYLKRRHEVEYCLDLACAVGATSGDAELELPLRPADMEGALALLRAKGLAPDDLLMALHPGASNGDAKRWPIERWARLGDLLARELGARVLLTGSASEVALASQVAALMDGAPISLAGETDLPTLFAVLSRCRLVVSGDTGPMHAAVALGVPTLALHGPTDPLLSGPCPKGAAGPAIALQHRVPCGPCYDLRDAAICRLGRAYCMEGISVEEALAAARRLLRAG